MYLFRQTFPVIWTVIAVIAPLRKFSEIRVGPCRQMSCHVKMVEHVQDVRALEPVHPMNHQEPSVQKQPRNGTYSCTCRWRIQPVPFGGQEMMNRGIGFLPRLRKMRKTCGQADPEVLWQQQVDDHIWEENGQPACLCQEDLDDLFCNICENITARVFLSIGTHRLDGDQNDSW